MSLLRLTRKPVLRWLTSRKSHSRDKQEPAYAPGTAPAGLQLVFRLMLVLNTLPLVTVIEANAKKNELDA